MGASFALKYATATWWRTAIWSLTAPLSAWSLTTRISKASATGRRKEPAGRCAT